MNKSFSTLDITKLLGIPRERLRSWMKEGYIKPTVQASGRGSRAVFTKRDVYVVAIFESMLNRGIKRVVASMLINRLLKEDRQLSQDYFVIRYDEKGNIHINSFSSKALGIDLVTGAFYRPVHQHDKYIQQDKAGQDIPFMPFSQRAQAAVIGSAENWESATIMNIGDIKAKVEAAIKRL